MKTLPPKPNTPTADLALLEEKRRAMRREALAYLEKADRLDALYAAVTGHVPAAAAQDGVAS